MNLMLHVTGTKIFGSKLWWVIPPLLVAGAAAAEPPTRASLREDGTLLVDGNAVFPIGMFSATLKGENCAHIAELGFNTVSNGGDAEDEFFHAAHAAGLYTIAPHYNWATFASRDEAMDMDKHEKEGFDLAFSYRDQIGRKPVDNLARWDHLPGVFGWYIFEEPKAAYSEALEFMYEIFKSHSPSHLVVGVSAEKVWYHHFLKSVDALMIDVFPYRPGDRAQPEILTYEMTRHAVEALRGKPVWILAQGGCMWKNWDVFPPLTEENFRNQAYLALIGGAKGYFMYSYPAVGHFGRLDESAEAGQWEKIAIVVAELKQLAPVLCDGRPDEDVRLAWKNPGGKGGPVLTRVLDHYGKKYLLIANIGSAPVTAQILGTNYGFPRAFDVRFFTGSPGLSVLGDQAGADTQTVNLPGKGEFPTIRVEPGSSGAFEITRLPAQPPPPPEGRVDLSVLPRGESQ